MFWLRKQLLLAPSLANALLIARAVGETLASSHKPLDILVTATASGLDVDVKGNGALDDQQRLALVHAALKHDLARLSNHGEVLLTQRMPLIAMGKAVVAPPPGAFLQATEAGEEVLATRVCAQIAGVKRIADLFCGIGTFDPWVISAPSDSRGARQCHFPRGRLFKLHKQIFCVDLLAGRRQNFGEISAKGQEIVARRTSLCQRHGHRRHALCREAPSRRPSKHRVMDAPARPHEAGRLLISELRCRLLVCRAL